jgi:hypothetical protein
MSTAGEGLTEPNLNRHPFPDADANRVLLSPDHPTGGLFFLVEIRHGTRTHRNAVRMSTACRRLDGGNTIEILQITVFAFRISRGRNIFLLKSGCV